MYQIFNQYDDIGFDYVKILDDVATGINTILQFQKKYEVNVILVNDENIRDINYQFRNINEPTDVISFELVDEENKNYLGDIFINIDAVYKQAADYGHSESREFAFLLCHGTLHLLGYNHLTKEQEQEMFSLQDEILNYINYRR